MARIYNIAERLAAKNQKPQIVLDADRTYKVNVSTPAVLFIMAASEDDKINDVEKVDKTIQIALGKEALDYMNEQDYQLPAKMLIIDTIMAAIGDKELEEVSEEERMKSEEPEEVV